MPTHAQRQPRLLLLCSRMSIRQPKAYAPYALSVNLASVLVALAAVHGSRSVAIAATQILTTRGTTAPKPAEVTLTNGLKLCGKPSGVLVWRQPLSISVFYHCLPVDRSDGYAAHCDDNRLHMPQVRHQQIRQTQLLCSWWCMVPEVW